MAKSLNIANDLKNIIINIIKEQVYNLIYPIGSVVMTDSNANPNSKFGGTWELIDKQFKSTYKIYEGNDAASIFTINSSSITSGTLALAVHRTGHSLKIRFHWTTACDYADSDITLGSFRLDQLGVTSLMYTILGMLVGSDGGNGIMNITVENNGLMKCVDIVHKSGNSSITSGATPRLTMVLPISYNYMLDDFCDKFYWKRTK